MLKTEGQTDRRMLKTDGETDRRMLKTDGQTDRRMLKTDGQTDLAALGPVKRSSAHAVRGRSGRHAISASEVASASIKAAVSEEASSDLHTQNKQGKWTLARPPRRSRTCNSQGLSCWKRSRS